MRLMKAHKQLTHQQLMNKVSMNLSNLFKPEARTVKARIEDLIYRDYLERDKPLDYVLDRGKVECGYKYKA